MADEAKQAKAFVKSKIYRLFVSQNESTTRATLAKLRRGIGKPPGSMPELWEVTLDGLPEALCGTGDETSAGEWAVHTTLTLYALHQQGKDPRSHCMSQEGGTLGSSVRKLVKSEEDEKRIKRRFDAVATADSPEECSHHLRGLIQLLKAEDISLDYPVLAEDLYWFQFSSVRDAIRLRWGRDFYRRQEESDDKLSETIITGEDEYSHEKK